MRKTLKWITYILLLFLIVLMIGIGSFLYKSHKEIGHVKHWNNELHQVATTQDMTAHEAIIRAIILTESKGVQKDLMQSSESIYGEAHVITSETESLEAGISFLKEAIIKGEEAGVDIWTSVQAYNFGLNYIDFIKNNGGVHTLSLAEEYSRDILAPTLGNSEQATYRYKNPLAFWHNGGYLYKNGGNIFYAEMIKLNMTLIDWLG